MNITHASGHWLDRVLAGLGVASDERQECLTRGCAALGDVMVLFIEPAFGECNFLISRALVGELPPPGRCERLCQLALEVQADYCGPQAPMLCLDWPSRVLMVSIQMEFTRLPVDDAVQALLMQREMALQWRAALAEHAAGTPAHAGRLAIG